MQPSSELAQGGGGRADFRPKDPMGKSSHIGAIGMWWMLLGGGIAWFIQFLVLYVLAEFGGVAGWHEQLLLGVDMVSWGVLAVTLAALAVALWCGWLAKRASREFRELEPSRAETTPIGLDTELPAWKGVVAPHFLVQSAVVGNAIFAFIIVAQALPVFFF